MLHNLSFQIRDEFEETVQMSTYLVAFVVCDFVSVSQMSQKGINVSVIAAKDKIGQADFALKYNNDYLFVAWLREKMRGLISRFVGPLPRSWTTTTTSSGSSIR